MVLRNMARYSDVLRAGRTHPSDRGRFCLETLLESHALEDFEERSLQRHSPEPTESWQLLCERYTEWPLPLSMALPNLQSFQHRIVRIRRVTVLVEEPLLPYL